MEAFGKQLLKVLVTMMMFKVAKVLIKEGVEL